MSMPQPEKANPEIQENLETIDVQRKKNSSDHRQADNADNQHAELTSTRYGTALTTIKKRRDFQSIRGGARWSGPAFLMEARPARLMPQRPPTKSSPLEPTSQRRVAAPAIARFGFTITKKLGPAVTRNRIRRRLSHAIRAALASQSAAPYDYVVVARPPALDRTFTDLIKDVTTALNYIAKAKPKAARDTTSP
ncbi:MAG: ribonuclease P protein component [Hyphomicrobiaceae bacterium]|nr:ribonuclease P protein component [Hyphomicrobiaceae bacterium]